MARAWHEITRTTVASDHDERVANRADTAAGRLDGVVLLLVREGAGSVAEYMLGEPEDLTAAGELLGFKASPLPLEEGGYPELPTVRRMWHANVPWRSRLNRGAFSETHNRKLSDARRSVESLLEPDSYLGIAFRRRTVSENKRVRDWVSSELNSTGDGSEYVRGNTMVCRVSCGNVKGGASETGLLLGALSDVKEHRSLPRMGLLAAALALTVTVGALTVFAPWDWRSLLAPLGLLAAMLMVKMVGGLFQADMPAWWLTVPFMLAAPLAVGVLLPAPLPSWLLLPCLALLLFTFMRWVRRDPWDDIMRTPPRRAPWGSKRRATRADRMTRMGLDNGERMVCDYPLHRSSLIASTLIAAGIITPIADSSASSQVTRLAPSALLTVQGVPIGVDQADRACIIPADQLYKGVAVTGEQGSGKSVLTYGFMQWALAHRADTPPSVWGRDSSIIDFCMKDSKPVQAMESYHAKHGEPASRHVIRLADPSSPTIDLLGLTEGLDARTIGVRAAAAMQYSFEKGDIMNDSLDVIGSAMTIGTAAWRYDKANGGRLVERIRALSGDSQCFGCENAQRQNTPVGWALTALCGTEGQTGAARALGKVMRGLSVEQPDNVDYVQAARACEQLYGRASDNGRMTVSDRDLQQRTSASRNKLRQFTACEHVFDVQRRHAYTWRAILQHPAEYHVALAPVDARTALPERMDRILGAWLLYTLWNTMTQECQGWQSEGRHVMLVCDELSLLANSDDKVLRSLHEQGRSYGVILVFATQYAAQLSPDLQRSFLGYGSYCTFNTSDSEVADMAARRLTDDGGLDGWTAGSVVNLPAHWCAVRTRTAEQTQPSFLCHVRDFEHDPL